MGIELELGVLLFVSVVGKTMLARFEIETHRGRLLLKWLIIVGLTLGLYRFFGHGSLIVPLVALGIGSTFHWWWCRKHGIHPIHATPRERYYELRGWTRGTE